MDEMRLLLELQALEAQLEETRDMGKPETKNLKMMKEGLEGNKSEYENTKRLLEQKQKELKRNEQEVDGLKEKLKVANEQLYEGSNTPKELAQAQKNIDHLNRIIGENEEIALVKMEELESFQTLATNQRSELEGNIREFKEKYNIFKTSKEEYEKKTQEVENRINEIKKIVSSDTLAWFARVRVGYADRKAVALVKGGTCSGCNMMISFDQTKRLKASNDLLTCENCGRVIIPE